MLKIGKSVGDGGVNEVHDACLVQALLVLIKDLKGSPYLGTYDGDVGNLTKGAIKAFQTERVREPGSMDAGAGLRAAVAANLVPKLGLVEPDSATWKKLVELVPADYKEMRVIADTRTVYLPHEQADLDSSKAGVTGIPLAAAFRGNVLTFLDEMFATHGIAISVTPAWADGGRRTFADQRRLYDQVDENGNRVTQAGPGESNHNFGRAVDVGFQRLRWLKADGTVTEDEDWWLHKLAKAAKGAKRTVELFTAMRAIAIEGRAKLHQGPAKDWPHLQAYDDAGLDMAARLAALLNLVGKMKWSGARQRYRCDLGLGGSLVEVGTAVQIWDKAATIGPAEIARLRTEAARRTPPPPKPGARPAPPPEVKVTDIKATDVSAMKAALRADFEAADAAWQRWSTI